MHPDFISHIGVISSRNGVVIQDLLQNLRPLGIRVDFVHSGVEGADSATEILRGIEFFSKKKDAPQILILIRGGGSLESLQGFNNEEVVRALFCAPMPVLVGIGHDVDAPIATLVADWSASTPTAVAHVINESWASLTERVPVLHQSIATYFLERLHGIEYKAELALQNMRHVMSRVLIRFTAYENILQRAQKRIVVLIQNLDSQLESYVRNIKKNFLFDIENLRKRVNDYERLLAVSDPQKVLSRGYGIVYGPDGALVRHVREVTLGKTIRVRLEDGSFESEITKIDC
jgi:exodeoxyribonuclease VII large subunit